MHPHIHVFGASLPSYFTMYLLSYLVSIVVVIYLARRQHIPASETSGFVLCSIIAGMVGARLLYILYHLQYYIDQPARLRDIILRGFAYYGALYGGLLGGYLYTRIAKKNFLDLGDNLLIVLPLGHAIRKLGCFLNGCCYGIFTDHAVGRMFNDTTSQHLMNRHPVQLYEAAGNALIFVVLLILLKRRRYQGTVIAAYLLLYGIARLGTDFFRVDNAAVLAGFSISQIISIFTAVVGAVILIRLYRNGRALDEK